MCVSVCVCLFVCGVTCPQEGNLKRYPTPYPDELKNMVKTAQSVAHRLREEESGEEGRHNHVGLQDVGLKVSFHLCHTQICPHLCHTQICSHLCRTQVCPHTPPPPPLPYSDLPTHPHPSAILRSAHTRPPLCHTQICPHTPTPARLHHLNRQTLLTHSETVLLQSCSPPSHTPYFTNHTAHHVHCLLYNPPVRKRIFVLWLMHQSLYSIKVQ